MEELFFPVYFLIFLFYSCQVLGSHGRDPAVVAPASPFFTSPSPIVPAHPFLTHAQVEIVPACPLFSELGSDGYPSCSRDWYSLDHIAHNMGYLGV